MPSNSSKPEQIAFDLRAPSAQNFETFFISSCNEEAATWLRKPKAWPSNILALVGEAGTGKTHLATAFAQAQKGRVLNVNAPLRIKDCRGEIICVDNAQKWSEESLFILLNMALNGEMQSLLLTDRQSPIHWAVTLPDLRSRLKNITNVLLTPPDEALLEPIIKKIFSDYGRKVDKPLVDYMLAHCPREISELEIDIALIERRARAQKADVTKRFAAKVLRER